MASVVFFLVAIIVSSSHLVNSVYETADAIIIQADDDARDNDLGQSAYLMRHTLALNERSCLTRSGQVGSCTSIGACYATTKSHQLSQLQSWMLITRGTCIYIGAEGKQEYGVCCTMLSDADNNPDINNSFGSTMAVPVNPYTGQPNNGPSNYHLWLQNAPSNANIPTKDSVDGASDPKQSVQCGAGPTKVLSYDEQRIVGGTDAVKNSWPSIVSLRLRGRFFCGGSVISSTRILTAAHCVDRIRSSELRRRQLTVEFGMHKLNPSDAQVKTLVSRIAIHRGWDSSTNRNDIAILTILSPVVFSSTISPVCLPDVDTSEQFVGDDAAIVGWGTTQSGGSLPDVLQQATVKVIDNAKCRESYPRLVSSMLCAAAPGTDSCQGDSGGPLFVRTTPSGPWTQTGIVSYGIGCAYATFPGVYTRVTSYRSWIKSQTGV